MGRRHGKESEFQADRGEHDDGRAAGPVAGEGNNVDTATVIAFDHDGSAARTAGNWRERDAERTGGAGDEWVGAR